MASSDGSLSKKRPLDLLASLDEAFTGPTSHTKVSKPNVVPNTQQAYLKKKNKRKNKNKTTQQQQSSATTSTTTNSSFKQSTKKKDYDPLYGKLGEDILSIGLRRCSLQGEVKNFKKTSAMNNVLKKYITTLLKDSKSLQTESNASDKIKNKVLQLDNPIKSSTPSTNQKTTAFAQALYAKQLSARKKRQLNLHLLHGDMEYQAALQLSKIWKSYMSSFLGNDLSSIDQNDGMGLHTDKKAMNRIRAKIRTMDLMGCPIKIVRSCNPCNVGLEGVIISEKQEVVQICRPNGKILTIAKKGSRFCFELDQAQCQVVVDGNWLLEGRRRNATTNDDI